MTINDDPKALVAAVKRIGLENIWCRVHDRPLALVVDPLTVSARHRSYWPEVAKYYCAAWFELPQAAGCVLVRRDKHG